MIAWVFGVPVILMVMVLALDRLESRVVGPAERIGRIRKLVDTAHPDEIERQVAVMLAPVVEQPKSVARAS